MISTAMSHEPECWLCSVCYRHWVTGLDPRLRTAPECGHGGDVRLPTCIRDEADALRFLATAAREFRQAGLTL